MDTRIKRHYKYIRTPNKETESSLAVALTCISTFAFLGAKTGNYIGKEIEKSFCKSKEGDIGGMIGGGVGFVTGSAVGGYVYMTLTEHNPNFETWRKTCLTESVKTAITFSHSEDDILSHFTCPVSLCVMDIPAHTPAGIFYDMVFIMNCPTDENGNVKDPLRNGSYPDTAITPDFERSIVINKRARYLLKADLQNVQNQPELRTAIETQLQEIEKALEIRYENGREFIEDRRRNKVVTHEVYKEEMQQFEKIYGTDWQTDLDWSIDWVNTLNTRWMNFHPNDKIVGHN